MRNTLLAVLITALAWPVAAQAEMTDITLNFVAAVGDEAAVCGETYIGVGVDGATVGFSDFRFYVSNVHLLTADGAAVPVALAEDTPWQYANVALLDFEDGTAACGEVGNAPRNGQVTGTVPVGDYVGVQFDMGVPFDLNHADVLTAPAPLNIAAMWWNWQGGYKFIRVDLATDGPQTPAYNIHLGSTGCASPAGVVPPAEPCARPNLPTVTLMDFDPATDVIVADLAALLGEVALYASEPMPPGCMSGPDDPDCPDLFAGFGLALETGQCVDGTATCSAQAFFRVARAADVALVGRTDLTP